MFLFTTSKCIGCRAELTRSENAICLACHHKMARSFMLPRSGNMAEERMKDVCDIEWAYSHFIFNKGDSIVRKAVHEFKYHDNPKLAFELGQEVGTYMKENGMTHMIDILVPVPISWIRKISRGYNQAGEFAKGISHATGIELRTDILKRQSWARSQTKRSAEERKNVMSSNAFTAPKEILEVKGKKIAIVDDVLTTGSTLGACVRAMRARYKDIDIGILTFSINE